MILILEVYSMRNFNQFDSPKAEKPLNHWNTFCGSLTTKYRRLGRQGNEVKMEIEIEIESDIKSTAEAVGGE